MNRDKLLDKRFVGEAGGIPGLVRITVNGAGQALKVEIDDLVFKETDKQLISDLFVAALNDAFAQCDAYMKQELLRYYSELNSLGGGHGLGEYQNDQDPYDLGGLDITKYLKGDPDGNSGNNQN